MGDIKIIEDWLNNYIQFVEGKTKDTSSCGCKKQPQELTEFEKGKLYALKCVYSLIIENKRN